MGDMGEIFREAREDGQQKRANNLVSSISILQDRGIEFVKFSDTHLRVGDFDFWPSTGVFINIKTKWRGRGVFSLIKVLERK